jgi:hypothetical protein
MPKSKPRKKHIRVWDIPKIVFEEIIRIYGKGKGYEESNFPRELRVFQELNSREAGMKCLVCLEIFPKTEDREMQRIFYFWADMGIDSYRGFPEEFSYFSQEALLRVNGFKKTAGYRDTDSIVISFPRNHIEIRPRELRVVEDIITILHTVVSSSAFIKKTAGKL